MASKSPTSMAEILGVAPTPASTSTTTSGSGTPLEDGLLSLEKLTTSTKSVADYFKEKLLARSSTTAMFCTPQQDVQTDNDTHDTPRRGLGSSCLQVETRGEFDAETQRIGISKFSSLMSSTFLATAPSLPVTRREPIPEDVPSTESQNIEGQVEKQQKEKYSDDENHIVKKDKRKRQDDVKDLSEEHYEVTQTREERRCIRAERKARKEKKKAKIKGQS